METVDTIVIGAGMSGAAAARALATGGRSVVVLEARDRIGGRTWTDDEIGFPIDLGASWIHGIDGNPLEELREALGIESVEFTVGSFQPSGRPIVYHGPSGEKLTAVAKERWLADLALVEENLAMVAEIAPTGVTYAQIVESSVGAVSAAQRWDRSRSERIREFMRHRTEDLCGAWIDDLDAHGLDEEHVNGIEVVFPDGYGQFAARLLDGLDVRLEQEVVSVLRDGDGVLVTTAEGDEFRAENVVVTLPLGVLKAGSVTFSPPLPEGVSSAIDRLGMGVYDKVFFRFPMKFWDDDAYVLRQLGPVGVDWHSWYDMSRPTGSPTLAALTGGPSATRLESMTDEEIVDEGIDNLRRMYGPTVVPQPIRYRITRWGQDPYSLGSYSYLAAGATDADHDAIAAPVGGVLHLAGEHTWSDDPATVHGAMLSGLRAASRVLGREVTVGDLS